MNRYTFERAIRAKLTSQDCEFMDDLSSTLTFVVFNKKLKKAFTIPRPQTDEGWSLEQLNVIAQTLEYQDLEFLPLDYLLG